jgi:hypothetical protein
VEEELANVPRKDFLEMLSLPTRTHQKGPMRKDFTAFLVDFGTKAVSDALLCLLGFSLSLPASPSCELTFKLK